MYEAKTKPDESNVCTFLEQIEPLAKRTDALALLKIYEEATSWPAVLWGGKMIGFGKYQYRYKTGHSGEAFVTGFAAHSRGLTLYLYLEEATMHEFLQRLGKAKAGKSCVYINKLADIDVVVLIEMIKATMLFIGENFGDE